MLPPAPLTDLLTHAVINQPPLLGDQNLFAEDVALADASAREAPTWVTEYLAALGAEAGRAHWFEQGLLANRHPPLTVQHGGIEFVPAVGGGATACPV